MSKGERLVDADGELIPSLFEPDSDPPERKPVWVMGIATGSYFFRKEGDLLIPIRHRVELVVMWDEELRARTGEAYSLAKHGPMNQYSQLDRKGVEALLLLDEEVFQEPMTVQRSLSGVAKKEGGASRSHIFIESLAVEEAGGDPEAVIPKPDESFLLGLTPAKMLRKDEI